MGFHFLGDIIFVSAIVFLLCIKQKGNILCVSAFVFLLCIKQKVHLTERGFRMKTMPLANISFKLVLYLLITKLSLVESTNRTVFANEGMKTLLTCDFGQMIKVTDVIYGRQYCNECDENDQSFEDFNCYIKPIKKISRICDGLRKCELRVDSSIFGDPCPKGIFKKVDVIYQCKDLTLKSTYACEGRRVKLSCLPGEYIQIKTANYGYFSDVCLNGVDITTQEHCSDYTAKNIVAEQCDGRSFCSVIADSQTFRDPCKTGTYKLLDISYVCARNIQS